MFKINFTWFMFFKCGWWKKFKLHVAGIIFLLDRSERPGGWRKHRSGFNPYSLIQGPWLLALSTYPSRTCLNSTSLEKSFLTPNHNWPVLPLMPITQGQSPQNQIQPLKDWFTPLCTETLHSSLEFRLWCQTVQVQNSAHLLNYVTYPFYALFPCL